MIVAYNGLGRAVAGEVLSSLGGRERLESNVMLQTKPPREIGFEDVRWWTLDS